MRSPIALLSLVCFICCWIAEAQYGFSVPNPDVADLDDSLTIDQGTVVEFIWKVNSTWQPTIDGQTLLDSDGDVSLWLTSWATQDWGKCLAASVYSGGGGSWAYNVDLSDDEIDDRNGQFVYRLYPPVDSENTPYQDINTQVPSRGFIIRKASDVAAASQSQAAAASRSQAAAESSGAAASQSQAAAESQSQAAEASQSQVAEESQSQAAEASQSQVAEESQSQAAGASQSQDAAQSSTSQISATTSPPDLSSARSSNGPVTDPTLTTAAATYTNNSAAPTSSTAVVSNTNSPSSGDSLSTGAKAGIGIGAAAIALLAIVALLLFLDKRRQQKNKGAGGSSLGADQTTHVEPEKPMYAEHSRNSAPQILSPKPHHPIPVPQQSNGPVNPIYEAPGYRTDVGGTTYAGDGHLPNQGWAGHGAELPSQGGYGYGAELPTPNGYENRAELPEYQSRP